jgi:prepilin-type processing-associated H-X9-DG protein
MYTADYGGYLPASAVGYIWSTESNNNTTGMDWIGWSGDGRYLDGGAIAPYVGHPNPVFLVEYGSIPKASPLNQLQSGMNTSLFRCPSDDWTVRTQISYRCPAYPYSYSMNEMLGTGIGYLRLANVDAAEQQQCVPKITQVHHSSTKIMLMEEDAGTIDDGNAQPSFFNNPQPCYLAIRHSGVGAYTGLLQGIPHAEKRGNVVFCDGSAATVSRRFACSPEALLPLF